VGSCADAAWLLGPAAVPHDPAVAAEVAGARAALARGRALHDVGRFPEALAVMQQVAARAAAAAYRPLEAESLYWLAVVEGANGDPKTAEGTMRAALLAAEEGRHDEMVARAAANLAMLLGRSLLRPEDAWPWAELALAVVKRMGSPGKDEARVRFMRGA